MKELNAESSCVDRLLTGLTVVSLFVLALLLILFRLLVEAGGVGGHGPSAFLLDCRLRGNDLVGEDGSFFSSPR